jgi:hypothetical protein
MDKKILARDEDGWISCYMVEYYFPSIKSWILCPRVSTIDNSSAGLYEIQWTATEGYQSSTLVTYLVNPPTSHSHSLPRSLITTTYVIE